MDPIMKIYMFHHWLEDANENVELFKNHGYLIGSFINPEAVKQLIGGNNVSSSDEDFEATSRMIAEEAKKDNLDNKRKRRRRKIS